MFQQFYAKVFRPSIVISIGFLPCLLALPVVAGQSSDGRSFFNRSPRLIRAATSTVQSSAPSSYQFTVVVPQDAGEPLKAIKITQTENASMVTFDQEKTLAFAGDSFAGGSAIALANVRDGQLVSEALVSSANVSSVEVSSPQPVNSGETIVVFDPPVSPGTTVTIDLKAEKNPIPGIYLFGITAYPAGDKGIGQFLGYGRLHFNSTSRF